MKRMVGVGIDIVDVEVFKRLLNDKTQSWKAYFSNAELMYCYAKSNPAMHLAARFAAKEAVIKALSRYRISVRFDQIEIVMRNNRPTIKIRDTGSRALVYDVSLTHTPSIAGAIAMVHHVV